MRPDPFAEFVLDQLRDLEGVECRPMFGGHGLYHRATFFAIVYKGRVYFKTCERTRARYIARQSEPFRPSAKQTLKNYYEVPADVVEDREELAAWAREAIEVGESE